LANFNPRNSTSSFLKTGKNSLTNLNLWSNFNE